MRYEFRQQAQKHLRGQIKNRNKLQLNAHPWYGSRPEAELSKAIVTALLHVQKT